jgi:dihydrolipoamide dehydrogenase
VVVATGSSAGFPPIRGLEETRVWDNRDAAEAKEVPDRLIVVGGGPVGCELAQAFRRLGTRRVTLIEAGPQLLAGEEPFAGEEVRAALMAEGVLVLLGSQVHRVHREGDDQPVTALITSGQTVTADELLVAVGRWPNTADLGLETVGLRPGEPLEVDDHLRVRGVDGGWLYAVGDVNERSQLTHMGKYQARMAADHILGRTEPEPGGGGGDGDDGGGGGEPVGAWADHRAVPRVVYTDPQVAAVGLTERQAADAGVEARVVAVPLDSVAAAALQGEGVAGTAQVIVDRHRHVVIGATFTGPGVAELLHAATVAIVGEVPVARLRHAVPAFPTLSEVWLRLVEGYLGAS